MMMMQVLLVTGGADSDGNLLDSTEIYTPNSVDQGWVYEAWLPSPRETMVSATVQNSVFVFGEY